MPESASRTPKALHWWVLLISLAFPLFLLILLLTLLGQDRNWDLQNYHLYNTFAWLHGRLSFDIAPAQMQTWHNPLLDVPLYLMVRAGWPGFLISLWLTLPTMLALYFLLRMYALLGANAITHIGLAALALMATAGVASVAVLGTSFNDAFVAAGALGSLYLLLREDPDADRSLAWCLAGALTGATTGLKLTAAIYCLGLAGAAMAMPSWRQLPRRLAALLLGGLAGFALTYGYWGTLLLHLHGNPFFPYYNQIFHSPDATWTAHGDARYQPKSLIDALLIPIRLLEVGRRYSEIRLRDPRLLLGIISYALLLWRSHRNTMKPGDKRAARLQALTGFFFVSLLVWAFQYGIYRYVLPLEMLACLGLMLALDLLPPHRRESGPIIVCLLVIGVTFPASWGRSHFDGAFVDVQMPGLPPHSLVVLSGLSPLAYAVTALPDDIAAISIDNNFMHPDLCTALQTTAERRIATHAGPLWLLSGSEPQDAQGESDAKRYYGLTVAAACQPVVTNFRTLRLCPLRRDPRPVLCAAAASTPDR